MHQFDDIGMRDFLESINECCDEVSHAWSIYNLDVSALKDIKVKLNKFALENKEVILSFYTYASTKGRYTLVYYRPLLDIMCKYEEYHDDLMGFIKAILSEKKLTEDTDGSATKHVEDAANADERFRDSLFGEKEKITFPETIGNLDTFMGLYAFVDKVYDNFIYLSRKEDIASQKVKILIDLYANSVTAFLRQMIKELTSYICDMKYIINGGENPAVTKTEGSYELI